jgi:pyridoxal phosphate enzyme (YggS family)
MNQSKISEQLQKYWRELAPYNCLLIPVSKTKPIEDLMVAYDTGNKVFGENKVQELVEKQAALPTDIDWHYIGHLQRNKVKYIAPFVKLIHAVDSERLIKEINKQALKNNRVIDCLLQMHIAEEEAKFGFSSEEIVELTRSNVWNELENVKIIGLMGMATNTTRQEQIRQEFRKIKIMFDQLKGEDLPHQFELKEISMGMSADYKIALEEGSTMVRIGSAIFGLRNCQINA